MKKVTVSLAAAMLCFGLAGPAAAATYSYTYSDYSSVPLPINDSDGVDAGFTYADISSDGSLGDITDVNVFVDITHTWIGDLEILIGHSVDDGLNWKYVQLYSRDYSYPAQDMPGVLFDDQAEEDFISKVVPIQITPGGPLKYQHGSYKPSLKAPYYAEDRNELSFFNGDSAAGMWSLLLYDFVTGDAGNLNEFRVDIVTNAPPNAVPLPGAVILFGSGLGVLAAVRRVRQK